MKRCFLALPLAKPFSAEVDEFLRGARERLPEVRWGAAVNVHVTLHFFGSVTEEQIARIDAIAGNAAASEAPFELFLDGLGFFPDPARIRIIWAGLGGEVERLRRFQAGLEAAIVKAGFSTEDRPYSPHLTLGRTRGGRLRQPPSLAFSRTAARRIGEIVLYESLPGSPSGDPPVFYSPLLTYPLGLSGR